MDEHEFSSKEIADALLLCRIGVNSNGKLCKACPYDKYPGNCSDILLEDASNLIREKLCGGDTDGD